MNMTEHEVGASLDQRGLNKAALAKLEALVSQVPFVKKVDVRAPARERGWEAEAVIQTAHEKLRVLIDCKRRGEPRFVRESANRFVLLKGKQPGWDALVAAPYLSPESAAICREHGLGYLDLAGNCHLSFGQIYIHQEGFENPFREGRGASSLYAPKSERILRALLDPEHWQRNWTFRALGEQCQPGVSLGLVHRVVQRLCDLDLATKSENGVKLTKPEALLREWARNYRFDRNRVRRFYSLLAAKELERAVAEAIDALESTPNCEAALASFSAAARIAPYVRQHRIYLYLKGEFKQLVKHVELKEVSNGENVVVLEPYDDGVFYQAQKQAGGSIITHPVQTYLDVNAAGERGPEAAEHILVTVLRKRWRTP